MDPASLNVGKMIDKLLFLIFFELVIEGTFLIIVCHVIAIVQGPLLISGHDFASLLRLLAQDQSLTRAIARNPLVRVPIEAGSFIVPGDGDRKALPKCCEIGNRFHWPRFIQFPVPER